MILKIKKLINYQIYLLFFLLLVNLVLGVKHLRFAINIYGDDYYNFANDLMERSPLYTSSILPQGKDWVIEDDIYKKLEFQNWELKLYLAAQNIILKGKVSEKKCDLYNNLLNKTFNISILKGNRILGYSSFEKEIKVFKNHEKQTQKIFLYDCIEYYLIELR